MKFEKDVAHIVMHMVDGESHKHTFTAYNVSVTRLVANIMRFVNNKDVLINLDEVMIDPRDVESFEITNYDELYELELEREESE